MFKMILVPTDGSSLSDRAINAAVEFAKEYGSKVVGLSVAEPYPFTPMSASAYLDERATFEARAREIALDHVRKISAEAERFDVPCELVVAQSFNPSDDIIATAKQHGCDAIFMASHGRKGLERIFIGSVTYKVLAGTNIPVMVYR